MLTRRTGGSVRVGSVEHPFGRYVSVRLPIKHQYRRGNGGNIDFIMYRVYAHSVVSEIGRPVYLSMRSLDYADRRLFPAGIPFETQHSLRQRARHYDFIVDRIVSESMHCPAD